MSEAVAGPPQQVPPALQAHLSALFRTLPTPYLVMGPDDDLTVVEANEAYLANVSRSREDIIGRPVFEAFPPDADALDEHGVPRIRTSLLKVRDTGLPDTMPVQQYDVPDTLTGGRLTRFWSLIHAPVLDPAGTCVLVVQRAEDITDFVTERERGRSAVDAGEEWRRRAEEVQTDLYARSRELDAALQAKDLAARRLTSLAQVAFALTSADTVEDLAKVVFGDGLPVLGARGGSIAVRTEGSGVLELTITDSLGEGTRRAYAQMPLDSPMPTAKAARGIEVLIRDAQDAASHAGALEALAISGTAAWAILPLRAGGRLLGSLSVGWEQPQSFPAEEVELLRAFAAQCAQVLDRLQILTAERLAAEELQRISETLQRSLLTAPPTSEHLQIAVHYQPASELAQVGGDWYDAFRTVGGATSLVIGDVAGHDQDAAAAMAQVRNILRGTAQAVGAPPAAVLAEFDAALHHLELGVLATLVLAQIDEDPDEPGAWTMLWCNAGHPPPVLLRADGSCELLTRTPDLLVGLSPDAARSTHQISLHPGDTVLLYTDGLIETRGGDIEDDLERLRAHVARHSPTTGPQTLLDELVRTVTDRTDDVALLALHLPSAPTVPLPGS